MALWLGLRKIGLLVGNNKVVDIDTKLSEKSTNPISNKPVAEAIETLKTDIEAIEAVVELDGQTLSEHIGTLSELNTKVNSLESNNISTQNSITELNTSITSINSSIENLTNSINTINSSIETINQTISSLTTRIEKLEGYHTNNEGVNDDLTDLFS